MDSEETPCPACHKPNYLSDAKGRDLTCWMCGTVFEVPEPEGELYEDYRPAVDAFGFRYNDPDFGRAAFKGHYATPEDGDGEPDDRGCQWVSVVVDGDVRARYSWPCDTAGLPSFGGPTEGDDG